MIYSTIFFPQQTRSWHNSGKLWSKLLLPKGKKCMFTCTCVYKSALGLLFFNGTPVGTWRVIYTESLCTMLNKFKTHEFMCIWMMFKCVFVCVCVYAIWSQAQKSDYWGHINFREYFFTSLCVYPLHLAVIILQFL